MEFYINVTGNGQKTVKVMAEPTGVISKNTLRGAFLLESDVVVGLFKNGIALKCDDSVFHLQNEWNGADFELTWEEARRSRPATPILEEPKWQLKERWRFNALNWLYIIPPSKDCVVVLSSTTAATFYHGTHQAYVENLSSFVVVPVNLAQGGSITVVVAKIIPSVDLVLLRATNGVFPFSPRVERPRPGMKFCVIGFGHVDQSNETYSSGAIFTDTPHYYPNEQGAYMGPFWLGTARTSRGDSGGACISSDGFLIGMNVSTTCMPSTCHTNAISEAAVFVSKNALVGAEILENERLLLEKPADRKLQSSFNTEETILHVFK